MDQNQNKNTQDSDGQLSEDNTPITATPEPLAQSESQTSPVPQQNYSDADQVQPPTAATTPQPVASDQSQTPAAPTTTSQPPVSGPETYGYTPPQAVVGTGGFVDSAAQVPQDKPKGANLSRVLRPALWVIAAVLVLGGASAAAYYKLIVPNQPENVLRTALMNTLQARQIGYSGTLNASPTGSGSINMAGKLTYSGSLDSSKKADDTNLNLTVSGINVGGEIRYVNQNAYFKFGDLSNLATMAGNLYPSVKTQAQSVSSDLSNKWIEVDSTLIDQSGLQCLLNDNQQLTNADIGQLEGAYKSDQFVKINKTSSTVLGGAPTEKFDITINDNKGAKFIDSTYKLPMYASIKKCGDGKITNSDVHGDNKSHALTLWVDKSSKKISQVSFSYSEGNGTSTGENLNSLTSLSYKSVSISAPANAEPFMVAMTKLESDLGLSQGAASGPDLTNLFNSSSSSNSVLQ